MQRNIHMMRYDVKTTNVLESINILNGTDSSHAWNHSRNLNITHIQLV